MVPLVRRRWRTSFGADVPPSSTGAVIYGAKDRRRPLTRRPRPIPSHSPPPPKGVWQGGGEGAALSEGD